MFLTQVAHSGKSPFDDLFKAKDQRWLKIFNISENDLFHFRFFYIFKD
jgi:antitoxin component of RelBE/YafQ-DinJ toxin-antitoxin module